MMTEAEFVAMLGGEDSVSFSFSKVKELYDSNERLVSASRAVLDWVLENKFNVGSMDSSHPLQQLCEALI